MKLVKLFIAFMILLISGICASASGFDRGLCTFNGVRLSGKVKIVDKDADVKVMIVHDGADLRVKLNDKSDRCGSWRLVDKGENLKVSFVSDDPDITIAVR